MDLSLFDYHLPAERIAQTPIEPRDHSRLLVISKDSEALSSKDREAMLSKDREAMLSRDNETSQSLDREALSSQDREAAYIHDYFYHLKQYLQPGDVLVFNQTRVLPVRLLGHKAETGGRAECLLLHPVQGDTWTCLVRPGRRIPPGTRLIFHNGEMEGLVLDRTGDGERLVRLSWKGDFQEALSRSGVIPLPPYIHEKLEDPERYQTVYGTVPGSAAASTAGLHFTEESLQSLRDLGVQLLPVLLHVGLGTFRPVEEEQIEDHKMHSEYCEVSEETAEAINRAKEEGRRIISVGTTALRTLEARGQSGKVLSGAGWTDIFIYPGYHFCIVDCLLTNFHLPKSSLLMLVSALAGRERVLDAYAEAVREKYRFFSFGDAMLIL